MYGDGVVADDGEKTAFRRAEKKYKLYYDHNSQKKKRPRPVDLSSVIDFKSILDSFNQTGETPPRVYALGRGFDRPVFCLEDSPGFYFIPGALSVEEQCHWIRESLRSFPQPPNRTNHNAFYGHVHDLFTASKERKVLVEDLGSPGELDYPSTEGAQRWKFLDETVAPFKGSPRKTILASMLLRKLRWTTLGLQFDWSKRNYNVYLPHNKIPDALIQLARKMAAPAMSTAEEFKPEAAIVNYFGLVTSGDTLGGHLDDMEADWNKPIVSISLGCKAIFLLGGKSRQDEPVGMFLRSGDIVLMAGEARECFHGVPRIFTDKLHAEIAPLQMHLSSEDNGCFLEYIRTSRININIRQVF